MLVVTLPSLSFCPLLPPPHTFAHRAICMCNEPWDEELEAVEHLQYMSAAQRQIAEVRQLAASNVFKGGDDEADYYEADDVGSVEYSELWADDIETHEHLRQLTALDKQVDRLKQIGPLHGGGSHKRRLQEPRMTLSRKMALSRGMGMASTLALAPTAARSPG